LTTSKEKILKKRTLLQKIVNVFLYTGIVLLIIFLIFLGFSQTATFRKLLRDNIVSAANKNLNGHLSIGKIDGTIFTSIVLRNTEINMGSDTLFNAGIIEVKTSPLDIFLKRIYIRKIEVSDAKIAFIADSSGSLNISRLFPTTPKDSVHSKFPFIIIAPEVKLTNVIFSMKDIKNLHSTGIYDELNLHDLAVSNLNLSLSATADIGNNVYDVLINNFSLNLNSKNFKLKKLSGEIFADTNGVYINNLKIITNSSDILLKAKVNKFNLFDSTAFSKIEKSDFNINLNSSAFNFDDLSYFVAPVNFLKGTASVVIEATGTLKDFAYNRIELNYRDTHLKLKGKVQNVLSAEKMFISADFINSSVKESDANYLMPSIGIPEYNEYGIVKFDTLKYSGNPLNFSTTAIIKTDRGGAAVNGTLDLRKEDMLYNVQFATRNLDLAPLTGITTNLNSKGFIKGSGVSPERLNSTLRFTGSGSFKGNNTFDSLKITADANNKKVNYKVDFRSDTTTAALSGNFDFSNKDNPAYNINGAIKSLNLAVFTGDTSFKSSLNFVFDGNGNGIKPDNLNLYLTLKLNKSVIHNVFIDSTRAIADIRSNDKGERVINLISDLADITFTGNYSISNAVDLISKESGIISSEVQDKLNTILYPDSVFNRQVKTGIAVQTSKRKNNNNVSSFSQPMNIKYYVEFKDFNLLSLFLGSNTFSVDGDMSGEIKSSGNDISVSAITNLNYLKYWEQSNIYFLSNFNLNLGLKNNIQSTSFNDLSANLQVTSDRIFAGGDIRDVKLNMKLLNEAADVQASCNIEGSSDAKISGKVYLTGGKIGLNLDTLKYAYNNFRLTNKGNINLSYSKNNISFDNFNLIRNKSEIGIKGTLSRYGSQDLKIEMNNINGNDMLVNLFGFAPDSTISTTIHLNGEVTGNFSNPVAMINFGFDSLTFKNKRLGYLKGELNYSNQNLAVNVNIVDSTNGKSVPSLILKGNVPVDLAFTAVEERFNKSKQMDLTLHADNFDLSPFANTLPAIRRISGSLTTNLSLTGTFDNPNPSGYITINNGDFVLEANNLEYNAGIKLSIEEKNLKIDSLVISNPPGTKGGGTMTGSGSALLDNLMITSANISLTGDLKVLGDESKSASPSVYGDLVIQTDGNLQITTDFKKYYLKAPIIVKQANLTFPLAQTGYSSNTQNFRYRFAAENSNTVVKEKNFEDLINIAKEKNSKNNPEQSNSPIAFDYILNVSFQNEAVLKFAISRELNQNLTARIRGNIEYDNVGGKSSTKGELNLLEGSTLEFIKTLEATGTIRFENEVNNPYLNIVATYKNYYQPPETDSKEELVAVKIKLKGLLKDLSQNFKKDKNNVSVYVGSDNIDNDKQDDTKDAGDALYFLLIGKFASDLSQQQKSQAVGSNIGTSTATSFAGSLIGGFLNNYFGDAVRGVELRSVGQTTRFNLIGKVNNFTYTIGGSTDVFQDLSQANVKIEYPIFKNLLIRVERKEAITQTNIANEMINELGLKYRFEF
jgi:hypothetical protein